MFQDRTTPFILSINRGIVRTLAAMLLLGLCSVKTALAQRENHADLTYTGGGTLNSLSANVVRNFLLLPSEKLRLGVGIRGGYVFGNPAVFTTAPAKHTSVAGGIDTLKVENPQFFSFNISLNAGYFLTPKISLGGSLDFAGLTFGMKRDADFYPGQAALSDNPQRQALKDTRVKPMRNNIYLTGDRNKGTLISELYIRYAPVERISVKAGYGFLISEYASTNRIGYKDNYRFRYTSGQFVLGIGYHFI